MPAQLVNGFEQLLLLCRRQAVFKSCYSPAHLGWLMCWLQQPRRMQSLQHTTTDNLMSLTTNGRGLTGRSWL